MKKYSLIEILIVSLMVLAGLTLLVGGINSIGIQTQQYSALVVDKHYKAGYYTTSSSVGANGVATTTQTYHAPSHTVYAEVEGEKVSCSVSAGKYETFAINQKATVRAGSGRIFSSLVCKDISA